MLELDESAVEERFVRVGGPGGQNVNKVATGVELRFDVARAAGLSETAKARLVRIAGSRMTAEGVLVLVASRFRTQARNRDDARERLAALIARACAPPPPPRLKTRPTLASKTRRLDGKARRGALKAGRGRVRPED